MTPSAVLKVIRSGSELGAALGANLAASAVGTGAAGLASACIAATAAFIGIGGTIGEHNADRAQQRIESRLREILDDHNHLEHALRLIAAEHDMHEWVSAQRCDELRCLLGFSEEKISQVLGQQEDLQNLVVYVGDRLSRWCAEHDIVEAKILGAVENGFVAVREKLEAGFNAVLDALPAAKSLEIIEDEIPNPVQSLFDEGRAHANEGRYGDARAKYEEALGLAESLKHPVARLTAKVGIASLRRIDDPDSARALFHECLEDLRLTPSDRLREDVISTLGDMESLCGNLLEAKALLKEAQKIAGRLGNHLRTAENLAALALVADQEGQLSEAEKLFDQAAELFMAEYQRKDPKTEKAAMRGIGICFNNRSVTLKRKLDLVGALASLDQAAKWLRKSASDDDLIRTLFLIAEARFADARWEEGLGALQESLQIAHKRNDHGWIARCLDLSGKLKFTLGDHKGALGDFAAALNLIREKGKPQELLRHLGKVARLCVQHGLTDEARKLLQEEAELGQKHDLLEHYANAVLELAEMEEGPESGAQRTKALQTAIGALEKVLLTVQGPSQQAFQMGRIGSLHHRLGNYEEALVWLARAKSMFEKAGDVGGIGNCMGTIADVKRDQNKPDEEIGAYREILALAEGKPLHDLIARTKNNLGVRLMQDCYLREAKQAFEEADDLCAKHYLQELRDQVLFNLERVQYLIEAHKPSEMNLEQLIQELHDLVAFFPEAKNSFLRFWYYSRNAELHANCRALVGVKLLIEDDDTASFLALAGKLSPFSDLNLQVVTAEYPGWGIDFVPYPKDWPLPRRVAIPEVKQEVDEIQYVTFVRGGLHWPYSFTSDEATSEQSGMTGAVLFGRARGLPPQAGSLMLDCTAEFLLRNRVLFFPVERSDAASRLANDLRLAREQDLIPVYFEHLPLSDDIEGIAQLVLPFPIFTSSISNDIRRQVLDVKRNLIRVLAAKDDAEAVACLGEMQSVLQELQSVGASSEVIPMTAHLVRVPIRQTLERHLVFVRHPD